MPVPSNPTIASIITEALKRGGIVQPNSTQIADATEHAFREVKADIMLAARDHPLLRDTTLQACTIGKSRYAWPTAARSIRAVYLLEGGDAMRGAAQAGASTTITIDASDTHSENELRGRLICILTGTGINQYRQITAYNSATKVATIDTAWITTPVNGDTYVITTMSKRLWPLEERDYWQWSGVLWWSANTWVPTTPHGVMFHGRELWLTTPPDRAYALIINYYTDMDRLDDTGTLFTHLLREWRSLWVAGLAVKTTQRYDYDKASLKHGAKFANLTQLRQEYQELLGQLGGQASTIPQVVYTDV